LRRRYPQAEGEGMSGEVKPWPKVTGVPMELPKPIVRPCDYSLMNAVVRLEEQLGTIEAYNRLVTVCAALKAQIDDGKAKPQHPMFATHPKGVPL
jgi:hypothetical protein